MSKMERSDRLSAHSELLQSPPDGGEPSIRLAKGKTVALRRYRSEAPPTRPIPATEVPEQLAENASAPERAPRSGRRRWMRWALFMLLPLLLLGGVYWDHARHFETTDDAFIAARQFPIAPKVSGYVTAVPVTDNQHVAAGDVIARIDDRDYRAALDQAQAQVASAQAGIRNIEAQISVQQAQINANQARVEQAQAALSFAQQQAARYEDLAQKGSGSVEDAQQYASQLSQQQAALQSAQATLELAQRQIESLRAQRDSAAASLAQAKAQREQAQLNLSFTTVTAAQAGRIVALSAAVGQFAQPGTSLTMFVPDEIWVTANFKENELEAMRPGQPVTLQIDAYPERTIRGHVASVQPGSGPAAAARECHGQLRQDRPARAGQDHHGRSADGCRARPGHVGGPDRAHRSRTLVVRAAEGVAMSAGGSRAGTPAAASGAAANPWLITLMVALATFMEVLDTTTANVALTYVAGDMGVSADEASWMITNYLVANAVALTSSSFLARLLGRKTFFLVCLALFTASSVLSGFAWNLQSLLVFRILQGLGGGGMVPVSQSILADTFPPEKRSQGFALFGVAVVVAPVVGPMLGGWLSDNISWRWSF
jgi:membrane fusion protein, multidrug efflux system